VPFLFCAFVSALFPPVAAAAPSKGDHAKTQSREAAKKKMMARAARRKQLNDAHTKPYASPLLCAFSALRLCVKNLPSQQPHRHIA
jgi:hypothetical protein